MGGKEVSSPPLALRFLPVATISAVALRLGGAGAGDEKLGEPACDVLSAGASLGTADIAGPSQKASR
jgi:hypothetical protein